MPEYKNVATVEIETGFEEFEWPEDESSLFNKTWWVDKDGDLGILLDYDDSARLLFVDRSYSWISVDSLRSQVRQGQAYPVAVRIKARRVEP